MNALTVKIDDHEIDYIPILTNAHIAYDYASTIHVIDSYSTNYNQKARLILIPNASEDYQRGRYVSGLFFSERVDLSMDQINCINGELWKRLHKSEDSQIGVPKTVEK
jgi:hypothetical protein